METDRIASTLLGKKIEGFKEYNPSVLVAIPRNENRKQYNINGGELPFSGYDIWHCYEFSAMTENNLPVTRVLKIKYSCENEYIIESKSLKLYLNSFNMTKFGKTINECLDYCKQIITKDLNKELNTNIEVNFIEPSTQREEILQNYKKITDLTDSENIEITQFKESPEVLKIYKENHEIKEHHLMFDSLRSNCRVTHQPDFGDVFIYYKSKKEIDYESLIKYLVSFRNEYHFHEECCEMIFKRLFDILNDTDELMVCALYTRRGGIDITPIRYSKGLKLKEVEKLIDITIFSRYGIKQ